MVAAIAFIVVLAWILACAIVYCALVLGGQPDDLTERMLAWIDYQENA